MTVTLDTRATCPRCLSQVAAAATGCSGCELTFVRRGGVLDVLGDDLRETRAAEVEAFYERAPFPGYAPGEDAASLMDRSRQSPFLTALDEAVPAAGRFLSLGCGTAQVPAFLALAGPRRQVVAVDGCAASLAEADRFAQRVALRNLQLVRADLFDLPLEAEAWDVVSCRGVVHHTPDPPAAIARVASHVAPGGVLILGFYENVGRVVHRMRRVVSRLRRGKPVRVLDPILRRRDLHDEKKRRWIEDQYHHPLEHLLPLPRVLAQLESLGFEWVRSVPPSPHGGLFERTPRPSRGALMARRLGWAVAGLTDPDAGLVALVARRARGAPQP